MALTMADLIPDVTDALQGRTDISNAQAMKYIARAVQELSESYPFEELRTTGPTVVLTANTTQYPIANFLNGTDDYTSPESFGIFVDFPNNTVVGSMKYRGMKAIETMVSPATVGLPSYFTRFGSSFFFGPTPALGYSVFLRYQIRHPFPADAALLTTTPITMPNEWREIIAYSAAMRVAVVKRWTDQRKELHDLLYGDPEFQMSEGKRGRPGLIAARLFQVERDAKFDCRQLTVSIGRYTAR